MGGTLIKTLCRSQSFPLFGIPCGLTNGLGFEKGIKYPLYPAKALKIGLPKTIHKTLHWRMQAILEGMQLPEEGVMVLPEGMATSIGGNLSSEGKLITTYLQPIDGKAPNQHDLFRLSTKRFFPRIFHADFPVVTLTAGWQGAFYHWVHEVLPRLHLVEKSDKCFARIYVESALPFQRESLELLGIKEEQIINAKDIHAVRTPQLIIPSIPEIPRDWSCHFLREKILPKISQRPALKLYISRNDASKRRILNEEEIMPLLKTYGFEKVVLSEHSFKEQVELFSAANVIVGPHGAGFSHLVFCKKAAAVLEIFSPAYFHPCYWHISDRIGLYYHYLFGEGEHQANSSQDPDILVDPAKLEASLKLMTQCTLS